MECFGIPLGTWMKNSINYKQNNLSKISKIIGQGVEEGNAHSFKVCIDLRCIQAYHHLKQYLFEPVETRTRNSAPSDALFRLTQQEKLEDLGHLTGHDWSLQTEGQDL